MGRPHNNNIHTSHSMRLSSIQWLLCTASSTVNAASAAKVLYLDSNPDASTSPPARDQIVSPDTARLILAQRLGVGQYHSVAGADEEAIQQINAFGSQQQALFGQDKHKDQVSRLLVMVEGVDYDAEKEIQTTLHKDFRSFAISPAPHPADSAELFKTFEAEVRETIRLPSEEHDLRNFVSQLNGLNLADAALFDEHHAILRFSIKSKDQLSALNQAISGLADLAFTRDTSLTFVFTPSASSSTKPSKSPFGLTKSKRDSKALRQPQEKPLLTAHNAMTSDSLTPPEPISPNLAASKSKPLSGPIPTCFPSLNACQRGTNNCTSHGECILKWSTDTTNDGGSVSKQDCYGCACTKPEVRKNKDGTKKTTRFGGAACHKKDVVFPFWLLAGTTVGIIGVITFGLGMLYEMGNQELPSVIGAGVSGPKAGR